MGHLISAKAFKLILASSNLGQQEDITSVLSSLYPRHKYLPKLLLRIKDQSTNWEQPESLSNSLSCLRTSCYAS